MADVELAEGIAGPATNPVWVSLHDERLKQVDAVF
jgi:hypothetical protein